MTEKNAVDQATDKTNPIPEAGNATKGMSKFPYKGGMVKDSKDEVTTKKMTVPDFYKVKNGVNG